ncbi:MAG: YceD family protein [Gallionella sp.]
MYARPFIDSLEFAKSSQQIAGNVQSVELPRLQDVLENQDGVLSYTIKGGVDSSGHSFIDLSVRGALQLQCQRCLELLDYSVVHEARLLLCDQDDLEKLDDEAEIESILADPKLDVLNLLEEEIVLSLPISPRHEQGTCRLAGTEGEIGAVRNSFAILEQLKRS